MTAKPADLVITHRRDGTLYRLPDHEWTFLIVPWVVLSTGCCLISFFNHFPFGIGVGAVLFFALIFLAGPLEWHLFRGHTEVLLTADTLHLARKAGPFWWRYSVALADVRRIILFSSAGSARLVVDCKERCVPLSRGERLELLRRLQEELCRYGGIASLSVDEQGLLVRPFGPDGWTYSAYVLDGRLVVRTRHDWGISVRAVPLDNLYRITAADVSPDVYQVVAIGPGNRVAVLSGLHHREPAAAIGALLVLLCRPHVGRDLPFVVETGERQAERPVQPVYSRIKLECRSGRVIFTAPWARLVAEAGTLRIEQLSIFGNTTTLLHASQIRTVISWEWTETMAESGNSTTEYGIAIETIQAEPVRLKLAGVGRKDVEWLATTLRRLLVGEGDPEIRRHWSAAREPARGPQRT